LSNTLKETTSTSHQFHQQSNKKRYLVDAVEEIERDNADNGGNGVEYQASSLGNGGRKVLNVEFCENFVSKIWLATCKSISSSLVNLAAFDIFSLFYDGVFWSKSCVLALINPLSP
jgi:hypothetical protein